VDGISYDASRKKYDCVIDGHHNRSCDLRKLCGLKRDNVLVKIGHRNSQITQIYKKMINYQNHHIISFWIHVVISQSLSNRMLVIF
jgi:hypothetical protein